MALWICGRSRRDSYPKFPQSPLGDLGPWDFFWRTHRREREREREREKKKRLHVKSLAAEQARLQIECNAMQYKIEGAYNRMESFLTGRWTYKGGRGACKRDVAFKRKQYIKVHEIYFGSKFQILNTRKGFFALIVIQCWYSAYLSSVLWRNIKFTCSQQQTISQSSC